MKFCSFISIYTAYLIWLPIIVSVCSHIAVHASVQSIIYSSIYIQNIQIIYISNWEWFGEKIKLPGGLDDKAVSACLLAVDVTLVSADLFLLWAVDSFSEG